LQRNRLVRHLNYRFDLRFGAETLLPKRALTLLFLSLLISASTAVGQLGLPGLRVMPVDELAINADAIVRGRVKKIEKANYLGKYNQLVTLEVLDVVKGDSTLIGGQMKIWAGTRGNNVKDSYIKGVELLVFLEREQTFYYTLNHQHGQFLIEGDSVQRWRVQNPPPLPPPAPPNGNGANGVLKNKPVSETAETVPQDIAFNTISKDYVDVRKEIVNYLLIVNQETPTQKTPPNEP
jgi:hypothetical protein